ncbi:MAG: endonuclease, partial [Alphaproteobacteria bacterium]|nr:endonuclease [Alphaproteobacteria bacterium]
LLEPFDDGTPALLDAWTAMHGTTPHPHSFCIYEQLHKPPHTSDYILLTKDLLPRLTHVHYEVGTQVSDHQPVLIELADG